MFTNENINLCLDVNKDNVFSEIISRTESDDSRDKNFDIDDYSNSSNSEDQIDMEEILEPNELSMSIKNNEEYEKSVKSQMVVSIPYLPNFTVRGIFILFIERNISKVILCYRERKKTIIR